MPKAASMFWKAYFNVNNIRTMQINVSPVHKATIKVKRPFKYCPNSRSLEWAQCCTCRMQDEGYSIEKDCTCNWKTFVAITNGIYSCPKSAFYKKRINYFSYFKRPNESHIEIWLLGLSIIISNVSSVRFTSI